MEEQMQSPWSDGMVPTIMPARMLELTLVTRERDPDEAWRIAGSGDAFRANLRSLARALALARR